MILSDSVSTDEKHTDGPGIIVRTASCRRKNFVVVLQVPTLTQYVQATNDWHKSGIQKRIQNQKKLFWSVLGHCCEVVAHTYRL